MSNEDKNYTIQDVVRFIEWRRQQEKEVKTGLKNLINFVPKRTINDR